MARLASQLELKALRLDDGRALSLIREGKSLFRQELAKRDIAAANEPSKTHRIELPPRLFFDGVLRRLMPPAAYARYIDPHVADMHEEYFACLAKKDERGARWALIRGHLYVIPSWLWSQLGQLLARVLGKLI